MAGLSTSDDHLAGTRREPQRLSRAQFERRVFDRAPLLYDIELEAGWLADLIKDGFFERPIRGTNVGLHPVYSYDWRSYRRALELARFYSHRITDRADIRLMLFARRRADWDIREDLARQYIKHARNLTARVRSGYVDRSGDIPGGHKASFMKQLGPLDARFEEAGLRLGDDAYITWFRNAKRPTDGTEGELPRLPLGELVFKRPSARLSVMRFLFSVGRGLVAVKYRPIAVEKIIRTATLDQFEQARQFYEVVTSSFFQLVFDKLGIKIGRRMFEAIAYSVKSDPRWTSLILVLGLVLSRCPPIEVDLAELRLWLQSYDGPKWSSLSDLVPIFHHH